MRTLKTVPDWLRASFAGRPVGVDRENKVIRGYVVAQLGAFKSDRGRFDVESLQTIVAMMNAKPAGLKSRFTHPTLSSDGLGTLLGRSRLASLSTANVEGDGKLATIPAVRADLHLDPTAFNTPNGDLGTYVMDLADSDPDGLSSSLVLNIERVYELDDKGQNKTDENGNELPPIWRPTRLHASDIVDVGDAVDGLLAARLDATGLPDELVRRGAELLDKAFAGQTREVVEARCKAWLDRYLALRFGDEEQGGYFMAGGDAAGDMATLRRRLQQRVREAQK